MDIVDLTVAAAAGLRGAEVRVWVLDDGNDDAMRDLAARYGVGYIRRDEHTGAKAGNINNALTLTDAPFIAVFDSDHVADAGFLEATLGLHGGPQASRSCRRRSTTRTPTRTASPRRPGPSRRCSSARSPAARTGSTPSSAAAPTCCSAARRSRASAAFPTNSLTEDFELSIRLHETGWKSAYVPDVLSRGLGPEDMAAYVSQQQRWARGCLSGLPRALRARLPLKLKAQYLLSASYFLSGWTVLIYMSFPVIRLLTGGQPIAGINAPEFLLHFAPYFAVALTTAALAGAGAYTFAAFALAAANFWIHCLATVYTVLRKEGSFVVTPKKGAAARQPSAVMPALVAVGILVGVSIYGLIQEPGRGHAQQRLLRRRPRLDPDDRLLAGAREAARARLRVGRARRGRGLSRPVRELLVAIARARAGGGRRAAWPLGCGGSSDSVGQRPTAPAHRPPGRGRRRGASSTATWPTTAACSGSTRAATRSARDRPTAC